MDPNNQNELNKQMSNVIEYALDGTKIGFELIENQRYYFQQIIIPLKKRTILEYYRIYLTSIQNFKPILENASKPRS